MIWLIEVVHECHVAQQAFVSERFRKLKQRFGADLKPVKKTAEGQYGLLRGSTSAATENFLAKSTNRFIGYGGASDWSSGSPVPPPAESSSLTSTRGSLNTLDTMLVGNYVPPVPPSGNLDGSVDAPVVTPFSSEAVFFGEKPL